LLPAGADDRAPGAAALHWREEMNAADTGRMLVSKKLVLPTPPAVPISHGGPVRSKTPPTQDRGLVRVAWLKVAAPFGPALT
jgi:hypothetical protein